MNITTFNIRDYSTLSTEDFEKCFGHKPETLTVTCKTRERDYREYARSEEAFFGENNIYKVTMIGFMGELRAACNASTDTSKSIEERRKSSKIVKPILERMEKFIEKTFNIKKCFIGLINEMNAFCIPLCWDKNLVKEIKGNDGKIKRAVNSKLKVSLEDIVETKSGYKYKDPDGKLYCVAFGVQFFAKKGNKDLYTDAECAAIMTHEFGHAMQQAMCSINENLASNYIHAVFQDTYTLLNPVLGILTLGIAPLMSIASHKNYKKLKDEDPDYLGEAIIKDSIGAKKKDFDREKMGEYIQNTSDKTIRDLPKQKGGKIGRFFLKFFSFTFGGLFKIIDELITGVLAIPQNIYVASQNNFLKKNRRFEQFADIYTAAYGLGPDQASALAKIGNLFKYKQDYGLLSILNYVPGLNIVTGVCHYTRSSIQQLVAGYPDTNGRMAAIYKSLKNDLDNNKELSADDKKAIEKEIEVMNDTYNKYVFDWSPRGFVYALWHKFTFKNLKNTKSDAPTNVIEAMEEIQKENRFKNANKKPPKEDIDIDSNKLLSAMYTTVKNLKMDYGETGKKIASAVEGELNTL